MKIMFRDKQEIVISFARSLSLSGMWAIGIAEASRDERRFRDAIETICDRWNEWIEIVLSEPWASKKLFMATPSRSK